MKSFRVLCLLAVASSLTACSRASVEQNAAALAGQPVEETTIPQGAQAPAAESDRLEVIDLTAVPVVAAVSSTAPNGDQIVCRKRTRTGSHFTKRICTTQAELDAAREQAKRVFAIAQGVAP